MKLTKNDISRIDHYKLFYSHFISRIDIPDKLRRKYAQPTWIRDGIPATISKISADFLFNEDISLHFPDNKIEQELQNIYYKYKIQIILYEDALSNSYYGDSVLNIYVENEEPFVQSVNPIFYFPELHPFDIKRVLAQVFRWEQTIKIGENTKKYIIERRDDGLIITNKQYLIKKENDLEKFVHVPIGTDGVGLNTDGTPLKEQEKNPAGIFLSAHTPNLPAPNSFYGISDYQNLTTMFDELNNRFSRSSMTLDAHADPKMQLPRGVADQDGFVDTQKSYFLVDENAPLSVEPKYVTWDGKMQEVYDEIDKILQSILRNAEIPSVLVGMEDKGAESGRALRYRLMRLIAKIRRKQLYYENTIKHIMAVLYKIKTGKDIEMYKINVEFGDGIPNDELEEAQIVQILKVSDAISQDEAVNRTSRLQGADLIKEIDLIKSESTIIEPRKPEIIIGPMKPVQPLE